MMTMTGYRRAAPTVLTWRLCDLTMNLYLSNAIAMLVREDMYTATQGNVLTNLQQLLDVKLSCDSVSSYYLQKCIDGAKFQDLLTASIKVKGMDRVKRRSERARLNIRTFLAFLISLRQTAATITLRFPGTKIKTGSQQRHMTDMQIFHYSICGPSWEKDEMIFPQLKCQFFASVKPRRTSFDSH